MTYGEKLAGFALVTDYAFAIVTTDKSVGADWPGVLSAPVHYVRRMLSQWAILPNWVAQYTMITSGEIPGSGQRRRGERARH